MKFVHAADIHLDSPLTGLERYPGAPIDRIRGATRRALEALVDLCLEEAVDFLLLAGDLYDGTWKDYSTGLFFLAQMQRLRQGNVQVFLIRGNHDAASQITRHLRFPDNVHDLSVRRPETVRIASLGVAIHGQGYEKRAMTDDLAAKYPVPDDGAFNIGLLHTALDGRPGHEPYAPCSLSTLTSKGYDYWALGHVHRREVLCQDPWVVFPGNLQARHIKETGAKGATLVTVAAGRIVAVEHRPLDVVRFAVLTVDTSEAANADDAIDMIRDRLEKGMADTDGRALVARVVLIGATGAHLGLTTQAEHYKNEIRTAATGVAGDALWIEKVIFATRAPLDLGALRLREDAIGELLRALHALRSDDEGLGSLAGELAELRHKLPPELLRGDDALLLEDPDFLRRALEDVEQVLVPRLLSQEARVMRFEELRLIAFGAFTNVTLDVRSPKGVLHVIYGRNEAGKSTTLRALVGLLYGIKDTKDAHLHQLKELRVGAVLVGEDGQRADVVRRRGRDNTLLDRSGGALDESVLVRLMGGVPRELFENLFGLNHETLRNGGHALLEGQGNLGQSLFSAELGAEVRALSVSLRTEADDLFTPKAKTKPLNEAIKAFEEAKRRSVNLATPGDKYREQETTVEELKRELANCEANRKQAIAEQNRLQRAQQLLRPVREMERLVREREALGDVTLLPEGSSRARQEDSRAARDASAQLDLLALDIAELERQRATLHVPASLLEDGTRIEELHERLGAVRKASADRPRLAANLAHVRDDENAVAQKLRGSERVSALSPAKEARIKELMRARPALEEHARELARTVAAAEAELADTRRALAAAPAVEDASALRLAVTRAQREGDLDERLRQKQRERTRLAKRVTDQVAALGVVSGDLAQVRALGPPPLETIERFVRDWDAMEKQRSRLLEQTEKARQQKADAERQLAALEHGGKVPTEEALCDVRSARDDAFRGLKESIASESTAPAQITAVETGIRDADAIADRLRREADRVARRADLAAALASHTLEEKRLQADRSELDERARNADNSWRGLWQAARIEPLSPAEMRGWLTRYQAILGLVDACDDLDAEIHALEKQTALLVAELERALSRESDERVEERGVAELIDKAQGRLAKIDADTARRRTLERDEAELARKLAGHASQHGLIDAERTTFMTDWAEAVASLGLGSLASSEEAAAVLDALAELGVVTDRAKELARRVEGIDRDAKAFAAEVAELAKRHAPDAAAMPAEPLADELIRRYRKGTSDRDKLLVIEGQLATKRQLKDDQARRKSVAEARLLSLMQAARVETEDDLALAEARSEKARTLDDQVARLERELAEIGKGDAVASLVTEVLGLEQHALVAQIEELEEKRQALDEKRNDLRNDIGIAERGLARWRDTQSCEASEDAQEELAKVRELAERYVRARLSSVLLDREIERYRAKHQGPLLARSSELFRRLTLGSYTSLAVGYGDDDRPELRALRPDGKEVSVAGLSDGTRDQLFLALRLAGLERQASGPSPMPFVVDDVLIHFDDERARAAIELFAGLAESTQVLFFTHHARLVDLARQAIVASKLRVHELGKAEVLDETPEAEAQPWPKMRAQTP